MRYRHIITQIATYNDTLSAFRFTAPLQFASLAAREENSHEPHHPDSPKGDRRIFSLSHHKKPGFFSLHALGARNRVSSLLSQRLFAFSPEETRFLFTSQAGAINRVSSLEIRFLVT